MNRIRDRIVAFLNPKPSAEFQQRMEDARRNAKQESLNAIHGTSALKNIQVESLYDRLVIDRPENGKKGGRK